MNCAKTGLKRLFKLRPPSVGEAALKVVETAFSVVGWGKEAADFFARGIADYRARVRIASATPLVDGTGQALPAPVASAAAAVHHAAATDDWDALARLAGANGFVTSKANGREPTEVWRERAKDQDAIIKAPLTNLNGILEVPPRRGACLTADRPGYIFGNSNFSVQELRQLRYAGAVAYNRDEAEQVFERSLGTGTAEACIADDGTWWAFTDEGAETPPAGVHATCARSLVRKTTADGSDIPDGYLATVRAIHDAACRRDFDVLARYMSSAEFHGPSPKTDIASNLAVLRASADRLLPLLALVLEGTPDLDQGGLTYADPSGTRVLFARRGDPADSERNWILFTPSA